MKPVSQMSEEEKEQIRTWIKRWERVGQILERLRWESTRSADTAEAMPAFDGAFGAAIRDLPPKPYSGLMEQQKLFGRGRK